MRILLPNLARKVKEFFFSYGWSIIEVQGAMFKIAWGIFALMPFQVFKTTSIFASVATESEWGTFLVIFGALHLFAVSKGGLAFRIVLTMIAFFFWSFVVILAWQQSHTNGLLPFFFVIAIFMGMNLVRLAIEKKDAFNKNP